MFIVSMTSGEKKHPKKNNKKKQNIPVSFTIFIACANFKKCLDDKCHVIIKLIFHFKLKNILLGTKS